jgi:hypothetical protein
MGIHAESTADGTQPPTDRSSTLPAITITKQPRYVSNMNKITGGYAP